MPQEGFRGTRLSHYNEEPAMFTASSDRWQWQADVNKTISFCVWVLLQDGLQVPPFDRHPPGDGRLQVAGMTESGWRDWLRTLLDLQDKKPEASSEALAALSLQAWNAPANWAGDARVAVRLHELWEQHHQHWNEWQWQGFQRRRLPPPLEAPLQRQLWQALEPYRAHLPTLQVYLTEYPWPVSYLVPPVSVLLGTNDGVLDEATYAGSVLRAAETLAGITPTEAPDPG